MAKARIMATERSLLVSIAGVLESHAEELAQRWAEAYLASTQLDTAPTRNSLLADNLATINRLLAALRENDFSSYLSTSGRRWRERLSAGLPFQDALLSIYVFHQSCNEILSRGYPKRGELAQAIYSINTLAHQAVTALGEVYAEFNDREALQRNRELSVLNTIAATVSQSLQLEEILDAALGRVLELTGTPGGLIFLVDERSGELVVKTHRGLSLGYIAGVDRLKIGEGLAGQVAVSGQPIVLDNIADDPRVTRSVVKEEGMRGFAAVPLQSKGKIFGVMCTLSQDSQEALAGKVGLLTTIGQQIGTAIYNSQLYSESQRSVQELWLLNAVGEAGSRFLELRDILSDALDQIIKFPGIDGCEVLLFDRKSRELASVASRGMLAESKGSHEKSRIKVDRKEIERSIKTEKVALFENVLPDDHARQNLAEGGENKCLACVPLRTGDGIVGSINFLGYGKNTFTVRDAELLMAIGNRIGTAIEKATLYEELQRREHARRELLEKVISTQEEERKRVARELHDETGQALTALIMSLAAVEEILPSEMPEVKKRLAELKSLTNRTLEDIRKLMFDLRPTVLDDLGLIPALRWYIKSGAARSGIDIRLETGGFKGRLPAQVETVLFRIIQEALTNIMKYAEARKASVQLEINNSIASVLVQDNGKGFNVEQTLRAHEKGLGLMGMRERASLLGGTFSIESRPGRGTKLRVSIPLVV